MRTSAASLSRTNPYGSRLSTHLHRFRLVVTLEIRVDALGTEAKNASCWTDLDVRGYYFSTPRACLPPSPGWYIICDEHRRPLYVGRADNLDRRLNSPNGSLDNFAKRLRASDPVRNFIKAFRSSGIIPGLKVLFITEASICPALGVSPPLSELD
jgi:hypothetical protein